MRARRAVVLVVVATLVGVLVTPTAAAADGGLSIGVEQDPDTGEATVTVTRNGTAVADANVTASAPNGSYAGNGTYTTDANGTVTLPEPDATVDVELTAEAGGNSTTRTVELRPLAESVAVDVQQWPAGTSTVTVTQYGDPVENATVTVESAEPYAGNGTYETDANGTVTLPEPADNRTVEVGADVDGNVANTTAELVAHGLVVDVQQAGDASTTVTVTRHGEPAENATVAVEVVGNGSYEGTGTHETDANGTVSLPAPDEEVEVSVTATHEDDTAEVTITLHEEPAGGAFGQKVASFVHELLGDGETGIGQKVSAYATTNNPGNAQGPPEHAGPPEDAGPSEDAGPPEHAGPPEDAGAAEEDERGNASDRSGGPGDAGPDARRSGGNETSSGGSDEHPGNGHGPPEHAGR